MEITNEGMETVKTHEFSLKLQKIYANGLSHGNSEIECMADWVIFIAIALVSQDDKAEGTARELAEFINREQEMIISVIDDQSGIRRRSTAAR